RAREALPTRGLGLQAPAARGCQPVDARPPVVFRGRHFRLDVAVEVEPVESGIQRALADVQAVARELLNPSGEPPAVSGAKGQGLAERQIERSLQQFGSWHVEAPQPSIGI